VIDRRTFCGPRLWEQQARVRSMTSRAACRP
jgi:hypothetical protein